jgi:hypothetical protein
VVVGGWFLWFMLELTPGGVVVQRGCRAMMLAGIPGFVRLFVWFLQWNRSSPFISKKNGNMVSY